MKIRIKNHLVVFLVVTLSVIFAFSLIYVNSQNFENINQKAVYAICEKVTHDDFNLEALSYTISSDYDTGWKTTMEETHLLLFLMKQRWWKKIYFLN